MLNDVPRPYKTLINIATKKKTKPSAANYNNPNPIVDIIIIT
jgi:hypothetical protein